MIHEHELNGKMECNSNQESTEQNISDLTDNFEDIYNHIFMNIPNISNIPINNTNVNIIPNNIQNIQQIPSNQQFLIQYVLVLIFASLTDNFLSFSNKQHIYHYLPNM